MVQLFHFSVNLRIGRKGGQVVVYGTVLAVEIALVGEDDGSQDGVFLVEENRSDAKGGKVKKRGEFHGEFLPEDV